MSEDVFGNLGDALPDFVEDTLPEPPAVEEEAAPAVVEEQPVVETPVEEQPLVETPAAETAEEEAARLFAGKYKSIEELEKGYKELRDLQRRTAERAKATEMERAQLAARTQQIQQALQQTIPVVQQALAARQQQPPQPEQNAYGLDFPEEQQPQPGLDPRMVMPLVDMQVQQRMLEYQNAATQQRAASAEFENANSALQEFYSNHAEVEPQGEIDVSIANTIMSINQAWGPTGSTLDLTNPDIFEIAYEATKRPALRQVLEISPALIDTDAGLELARRQAALLEADLTPPATPSASSGTLVSQKKPVVERASSGTPPATEGTQQDEFDAAVLAFRRDRESKGSIFF